MSKDIISLSYVARLFSLKCTSIFIVQMYIDILLYCMKHPSPSHFLIMLILWQGRSVILAYCWMLYEQFEMMKSIWCLTNKPSWIFIMPTHQNNSLWVDMLVYSATVSWISTNQSLLLHLAEKQILITDGQTPDLLHLRQTC